MEYPKFTWNPDLGATCEEQPFVNVTKFGDGYEARVGYLINATPRNWSVTFEWKTPEGEILHFVCRSWIGKQTSFGVFEVSAKFEQVFE